MSPKNMAASVHARLADIARRTGRPFQELLQYYAMERFLYRFSKTRERSRQPRRGRQRRRTLPPACRAGTLGRRELQDEMDRGWAVARVTWELGTPYATHANAGGEVPRGRRRHDPSFEFLFDPPPGAREVKTPGASPG